VPRALKTYITNLGFFELAIAAPSMKAALEAWGMSHNAFQQGFAKQTQDPKIIAATLAQPGVVLRRAVGTTGEFGEDAKLPNTLPNIRPPRPKATKAAKQKPPKVKAEKKTSPAEIISFEKARARREKEKAAAEAQIEKRRKAREAAVDKAEAALERASERHQSKLAAFSDDQAKLDQQVRSQRDRWESERKKLETAIDRAKR